MSSLQQSINFFFLILIYAPINVALMLIVTLFFRLTNALFRLNFPLWALALAAAVPVFAMMYAFVDGVNQKRSWVSFRGSNYEGFLTTTLIINVVVSLNLWWVMVFTNLIFKNEPGLPFAFEKPQLIALGIYAALTLLFAIQPFINVGKAQLADFRSEKYSQKIKAIIASNNLEGFKKELENSLSPTEFKFQGEDRGLLAYLVAENKPELVAVLLKNHQSLLDHHRNWDIKSSEMIDVLVANGMNPNKIVEIFTASGQKDLLKVTIEKHQPDFTSEVPYITRNVMDHQDIELLDYLIAKGLTKKLDQTNETIEFFAQKEPFEILKFLIDKGFKVDPNDNRPVYWAIYNNDLPLLKHLFQSPFDVNKLQGEYTHLEDAIAGGKEEIFDFLLTQNPEVNTLHPTKLHGETNALLLAERYERPKMLEKLKNYISPK